MKFFCQSEICGSDLLSNICWFVRIYIKVEFIDYLFTDYNVKGNTSTQLPRANSSTYFKSNIPSKCNSYQLILIEAILADSLSS